MFAKRISLITIFAFLFLGASASGAAPHEYPKLANFYTNDPRVEDCEILSNYDMVVMPAGMVEVAPQIISELRALNPDMVILAYYPCALLWGETPDGAPVTIAYPDKVEACDWWLYDDKGNRMGSSDTAWPLNFTTRCPTDPYGRTIGEWLCSFIADEIYATGVWDGIFLDGSFEDPTWLNTVDTYFQDPPAMVDSNRDGVGDSPDDLALWWRTMLESFLSSLRQQLGDSAIIVANGKQFMHAHLNGGVRENFPKMHGGWEENMFSEYGYVTNCESFRTSPLVASMILCYASYANHTVYEPERTPAFLTFLRYTLASALMGDGYYVLEGMAGRCLWWEDYYDIDLGNPVSDARPDSMYDHCRRKMVPVYKRDFEKGVVICNPFSQYIQTESMKWIYPKDGLIVITESDAALEVAAVRDGIPRCVNPDVRVVGFDAAVTNPADYSAPAYVWTVTRRGGTVVNEGAISEYLIGKGRTDTLHVAGVFPEGPGCGTYTIEVNVAGPDMEIRSTDAVSILRAIEFVTERIKTDDPSGPESIESEEGNLLIYPQPAAFSSGQTMRMEVRGYQASTSKDCRISMYDVRGRLIRSIYEGVYGEGLSIEVGLTSKGGEEIAPGLYIIVLELGDLARTRKIVLLD